MNLDETRTGYGAGKAIGYVIAYVIASTMLFLIYTLKHYFSGTQGTWSYWCFAGIVLVIALAAYSVRRWLS